MNAWWRCGTCDAYVLQSEQTCPMCELSGRPDFASLERRLESLERWRKCKYGTYLATEEDVQEWSGPRPHYIKLTDETALSCYRKVEEAGFHWNISKVAGAGEIEEAYIVTIRAQPERWTFARACRVTLEAAICSCFDEAANIFPGLAGISYKGTTTALLVDVSAGEMGQPNV